MKKIFMAAMALVVSAAASAVTNYNHAVVINLKDGTTAKHLFSTNPQMIFDGATMYLGVTNEDATTASYAFQLDDIDAITYSSEAGSMGIGDVEASSTATIAFDGDRLVCAGFAPAAPVALYSVGGMQLYAGAADNDGHASIDLSQLQAGTYVAAVGSKSFKFIKK